MNTQVMKAGTGFDLQVTDMGSAMQLATMIANSQLAPKNFQNKPEDTLVAMMMGNELGLNPMQAIQNIAVVNGRPCVWGDAMLALVQNHPSFGGIEEDYDKDTMTASCTVWRKGGTKHTQTFSRADAETAGLWGRNTWKQYPKRMLAMRARGFALRNQFADALLGLITTEEAYDIPASGIEEVNEVKAISQLISAEQVAELTAIADEVNADMKKFCDYFKIGTIEGLHQNKFDQAKQMLNAKRKAS
jgi:hypothetical protein